MKTNLISCRHSFTGTLLNRAKQDPKIIVITSDARGSVTLDKFSKELPQQFVEVGIAEQNAVGIGAGMATAGLKPFVCGPACFYVARSLEQVKVDVAYSRNNVKIVGVSGGVAYGALGTTHHSLHDIAVLRTFPGMNVFLPCDVAQTEAITNLLVDLPEPAYMRLGRAAVPDVYTDNVPEFKVGGSHELLSGTDIAIFGAGETVYHCLEAGKHLQEKGYSVRVVDLYSVKPVDRLAIERAARECKCIITAEEHSIYGGIGGMVAEIVSQTQPRPMRILGIPDEDAIHGTSREIFQHYGIDTDGIYASAMSLLKSI